MCVCVYVYIYIYKNIYIYFYSRLSSVWIFEDLKTKHSSDGLNRLSKLTTYFAKLQTGYLQHFKEICLTDFLSSLILYYDDPGNLLSSLLVQKCMENWEMSQSLINLIETVYDFGVFVKKLTHLKNITK